MPKQHRIDRVLRQLGQKNDCFVDPNTLTIQVLVGKNQKHDLGNKSWGKIDYLQKVHDFSVIKVDKFSKTFRY